MNFGREIFFDAVTAQNPANFDADTVRLADNFGDFAAQRFSTRDLDDNFRVRQKFLIRQDNHAVDSLVIRFNGDFPAQMRQRADNNSVGVLDDFGNVTFAPPTKVVGDSDFDGVAVERAAQIFRRDENVGAAVVDGDEAEAAQVDAERADKRFRPHDSATTANFAVASAVTVPSRVSTVACMVMMFRR